MHLLRTSRLNESVPNGWLSDGARFLSPMMSGCAIGSYGATHGASNATTTMTAMTPDAMPACRTMRCVQCGRSLSVSASTNARIGDGVQQVGSQAPERYRCRCNDYTRRNQWIVARRDTVQNHPAHSRPRKDAFDKHRTGEQHRQRKAEQADCWYERVAKHVNPHHTSLAQSFRAGSADEIIRQDAQQLRALVPCHRRAGEQSKCDCRKRQMLEPVAQRRERPHVLVH